MARRPRCDRSVDEMICRISSIGRSIQRGERISRAGPTWSRR
ncbi:MAG TPA: hypothetical protein VGL80_23290 [Pseudonocardiaceae bacterium]